MKKKNSKTQTVKKENEKHSEHGVVIKKEKGVIPYVTTPLIYVLISLIVVLPILISFTGGAVNAVHNLQQDYWIDYSDIKTDTERFDDKSLSYENDKISLCEKVGVIKCEARGIKSEVFYGVNRVSLRNGAGLSTKSVFDSYKSKLNIAGYSSRAFKGLNNVKEGDKIVFETTDKVYEYTVISNEVCEYPEEASSYPMILSCDEEENAFSAFNSEKRYVVAGFSSVKDKKGE
jgi:sortase (surface protein transpeptidase)